MRQGIRYSDALRYGRNEWPTVMESIIAEQVRALGFDTTQPETIPAQVAARDPGWRMVVVTEAPKFGWRAEEAGLYRDHFAWFVSVGLEPTEALLAERAAGRVDEGFWPVRDGAGR